MLSSFVDARARALFAVICGAAAVGHGLLAAFFSWLTSRSGRTVHEAHYVGWMPLVPKRITCL